MTTATIGAHRPAESRWTPARRELTRWRAKTANATRAAAARAMDFRRAVLTVTGFGFVDASAYQVTVGVGLLVTGASVLVLEWLTSE
jgi:hypothetical protein